MGVMTFRLPSPASAPRHVEFRRSYATGLDRTPSRLGVEIRDRVMICSKDSPESVRVFLPWPVEGFGVPIVGTATLVERQEPYVLDLELARGKLNDVRNQLADWTQMGLRTPPELGETLKLALRAFIKAVGAREFPDECSRHAADCLRESWRAGERLMDIYSSQVLENRMTSGARLPTFMGGMFHGHPKALPKALDPTRVFNLANLAFGWRDAAPSEGQFRWEKLDAQIAWARSNGLRIEVGPLVELRKGLLPDWIWLWAGDADTISGLVADFVRQAVTRYRGKIPTWHVIHRVGGGEILGLTEEDQIRIAARAVQVARQADSSAHITIGVDRPWAEWMGASHFQLGPLHLCDYLLRGDIGLSGIALEVAPGYSAPGSHLRDLFEFSRLLDLYALLNVPLHVWMAAPSADGPDAGADPDVRVEPWQWPRPFEESRQTELAARWIALAVAKPYVRAVSWLQTEDAVPHFYPHAGLLRPDGKPKPLIAWLKRLRGDFLE